MILRKLSFPVILSLILSCNSATNENRNEHHDETVADTTLALNNNARWIMDSITNRHFIELHEMTNMFHVDPFPPVNAYQTYGKDMTNGINKMIQDCKMQGEAHEMLHHWLNPVIRQSHELSSVTDTTLARKISDSLHVRVDRFTQYFEEAQ